MENTLFVKYVENIYKDHNNEQYIALALNLNVDVNRKTINESTVYVLDENNNRITVQYEFDTKKIYLIDVERKLEKDKRYSITMLGGINGVKTIFGTYNAEDMIYDTICTLNAPLKSPIIINPSIDELVTKGFEIVYESYGNAVNIVISDDIMFKNELVNVVSHASPYVPSYEFKNDQQYFIKVSINDNGTEKYATTSFIYVDNIYSIKDSEANNDNITTYISDTSIKNDIMMLDKKSLTITTSKDIDSIELYVSKYSVAKLIINDLDNYFNTDLIRKLDTNKYEVTIINKVANIKLNNIEYFGDDNAMYICKIKYTDPVDDVFEYYTFIVPKRKLYITYDELEPNITSFQYDMYKLYSKIEQACNEIDYYAVSKIRDNKTIPVYVKDFIIDYIVLYLIDEYIKGNISIVSGSIGSFSFKIDGDSYNAIRNLYMEYKQRLIEHRNALYKKTRQGYAPSKYAIVGVNTIDTSSIIRTKI